MCDLSQIDVLILCGGLGKRLRKKVPETQKVLAPVDDRPFVDILINYLSKQGFRRFILCAGYKADSVEEYIRKAQGNLKVEISREQEALGTGGAIKYARELIKSDHFIALNGDSYCQLDYKMFFDFHLTRCSKVTLALVKQDDVGDFGSITMNRENRITGFKEKVKKDSPQLINAGIYCFTNEIFELMPKEKAFSLEKDFFPRLAGGDIYGFLTKGVFIDIGTPERYEQARTYFRKEG